MIDSPFTPGLPVPVELFVGRDEEIKRLEAHVVAASKGSLKVAFLSGERGIGKSSLAAYVRTLAERDHDMVSAHVMLGGANTVAEMVRRVFEAVLRESSEKKWYDPIKDFFGKTVQQADLFGLKLTFSPDEKQLTSLVRGFAPALQNLTAKLRAAKKGVGLVLTLDNINGLADSAEFAEWLKSFFDDVAINHPMPLCVLLVGLDDRRRSIVELNPSLGRTFEPFEMKPWSTTETERFFTEAFAAVSVRVDDRAMRALTRYSGGFPAVCHELGDAALRAASGATITEGAAAQGIIDAAQIIGTKYLKHQVVDAIRSKKYRSILERWIKKHGIGSPKLERSALKELLTGDEVANLDNFLARMKDLAVLVADDEAGPGAFRFGSLILQLYLALTFAPK